MFTPRSPLPKVPPVTDEKPINVTEEGVLRLLQSLKTGKAPGPDNLTKEHLCLDKINTARILVSIFNYSLRTGEIPDEWRLANVTPIYKQGNKLLPSNYRPVSLTSICCKIMEHIILHNLNNILDDIIYDNQHGFRRQLSCTTQLASVTHDIVENMDKKQNVHAAVLDFSKAFDTVPHHLIISKLIAHDIDPILVAWIANFLTDRKQRVIVNGASSEIIPITSGVPQGSVLGPALFILFVNDIADCVQFGTIRLFADDTIIYAPISDAADQRKLQRDLDQVFQWSITNGMKFNTSKSNIISFHNKKITNTPLLSYRLGGDTLVVVDQVKYLGVILSSDLSWDKHVRYIQGKAERVLGLLKHTLSRAPDKIKLIAYKTICRPILEYASAVWDPTQRSLSHKLEVIQNKALRFIFNIKGREASMTELRKEKQIHSLAKRRQQSRIDLFLTILRLEHLFPTISDTLTLMSSNSGINTRSNSFNSITANTNLYLQSIIIRTSRELRNGEMLAD